MAGRFDKLCFPNDALSRSCYFINIFPDNDKFITLIKQLKLIFPSHFTCHEFGCGSGAFSFGLEWFLKKNVTITANDINPMFMFYKNIQKVSNNVVIENFKNCPDLIISFAPDDPHHKGFENQLKDIFDNFKKREFNNFYLLAGHGFPGIAISLEMEKYLQNFKILFRLDVPTLYWEQSHIILYEIKL